MQRCFVFVALGFLAFDQASPLYAQTVAVTQTTADQSQLLSSRPPIQFNGSTGGQSVITIADTTRQQFDGVGAALTDSGAYLIYNTLTPAQRSTLLKNLFTPMGAGFNILKTGMSGSGFDMTAASYTYDDLSSGTDLGLNNFSVSHDDAYIVPVIQQTLGINQNTKIFALPFSPPAWMKTTTDLRSGYLNTTSSYEQSWANYFVRYVQAYQSRNIPIYTLAIQNEPDFFPLPAGYPQADMYAPDEANVIGYLGPALNNAHLGGTKILGWEHNWSVRMPPGYVEDGTAYPEILLGSSVAGPYLAGTAYHCYGGDPTAQSTLKQAFPASDIWDTECAGNPPGTPWASWFANEMGSHILPAVQNWGRSYIWWTLAQDKNDGPVYGNCTSQNCTPLVTIDNTVSPATITYNPEYYILAQVGRFVQPGADVLNSQSTGIGEAAFRNPDGSYVLVAYNGNTSASLITVNWNGHSFNYSLLPSSIATFTWTPPVASSITVVNDNSTGMSFNQFNYSGNWAYWGAPNWQANAYANDNHWSGNIGDYYTLEFQGVQALVYGSKDIWDGLGGFSVDGSAETAVDLYSPTRTDNAYLWGTPVLSPGTHTLKVRVTGQKDSAAQACIVPADRVDILSSPPVSVNDNTQGSGLNQFTYVGSWLYWGTQANAFNSDNHWSGNPGDYYTVKFTGIRAIVYGSKDVWNGYAGFSIDNGAEDNVDLYAPNRADNIPLWSTPMLPYGTHTLKVRVTGLASPASGSDIVPADRVDIVAQ